MSKSREAEGKRVIEDSRSAACFPYSPPFSESIFLLPLLHVIAPAKILDYMKAQNRPYSAVDVFNNLHKEFGKTVSL